MTNTICMLVLATAFCHCHRCCGKSDGITASGRKVRPEWTVACNVLPLGTKINLVGKGVRSVDDRLRPKYTYRNGLPCVDLYFTDHNTAAKWGKRIMQIEIISKPNRKRQIR